MNVIKRLILKFIKSRHRMDGLVVNKDGTIEHRKLTEKEYAGAMKRETDFQHNELVRELNKI